MGRMLRLCMVRIPGRAETYICFWRYMHVRPPIQKMDESLRYVCLRFAAVEQHENATFEFWSAPQDSSMTVGVWKVTEP